MSVNAIEKILSSNDTGETGGHQAGILIPKSGNVLQFFPSLLAKTKNPRHPIDLIDDNGTLWTFSFIYYNNKFFGGTRNEYRLTGMTAYIRENNLKTNDKVILYKEDNKNFRITYKRAKVNSGRIVLSISWRVLEGKF